MLGVPVERDRLEALTRAQNADLQRLNAELEQRVAERTRALEQANQQGLGAVSLDGRLIDIASIRMAEALIAKADSIVIHVSDHGKAMKLTSATGKVTVFNGNDKTEAPLALIGDKLEAKGSFKVGAGTKVLAEGIRRLAEAMARSGVGIQVFIEIDVGQGRCGVPPGEAAVTLAQAIAAQPVLRFAGLPNFAPEILQRVRVKDPLKAKHLKKALESLAEEGVTQLFRPDLGADFIVGAVGQLQFEVMADRLANEYQLDCIFENAPYAEARWLSGPKADMDDFANKHKSAMAEDIDAAPVFLAKSAWEIGYVGERFPGLSFQRTKERG